jgi:DNA-binding IclR family transcriptional regulator
MEDKRFLLRELKRTSIIPLSKRQSDEARWTYRVQGPQLRTPGGKVGEPEQAGSGEQEDSVRDAPGKSVGAVVAAVKVLRALHASVRPLNASAVARATGLYRGTAYNLLRTLQAEGFVSYDAPTRTYSVSLGILELAHGVLQRSGLMDLARPLMYEISSAHRVMIYLSKVVAPSSLLLLDWVGQAFHSDQYVTVGRRQVEPRGAAAVIIAAFGNGNGAESEYEARFSKSALWYQKPSPPEFLTRVREAKMAGVAFDYGAAYQGVTMVSVPIFSPSWDLLLIMTALGYSHDQEKGAVAALSRELQSAAVRLSESSRALRL